MCFAGNATNPLSRLIPPIAWLQRFPSNVGMEHPPFSGQAMLPPPGRRQRQQQILSMPAARTIPHIGPSDAKLQHNIGAGSPAELEHHLVRVPAALLDRYRHGELPGPDESLTILFPHARASGISSLTPPLHNVVYCHEWGRSMRFWRQERSNEELRLVLRLGIGRLCNRLAHLSDKAYAFFKYIGETPDTRDERYVAHASKTGGGAPTFSAAILSWGPPTTSLDLWVGEQGNVGRSSAGKQLRKVGEAVYAQLANVGLPDGTGANEQACGPWPAGGHIRSRLQDLRRVPSRVTRGKKKEKRCKAAEPRTPAPGQSAIKFLLERAKWLGCWCVQDGLYRCQCVLVSQLTGNDDIKAYAALRGMLTVEECHAWMAMTGGTWCAE
jgi:hypothetical protein